MTRNYEKIHSEICSKRNILTVSALSDSFDIGLSVLCTCVSRAMLQMWTKPAPHLQQLQQSEITEDFRLFSYYNDISNMKCSQKKTLTVFVSTATALINISAEFTFTSIFLFDIFCTTTILK